MTDIIRYSLPVRLSRSKSVINAIDGVASPGRVLLCSGSPPVGFAAATEILASMLMSKPCGVVNDAADLVFSSISDAMVTVDGLATWARIEDGNGNAIADLDVGEVGSGSAITLTDANLKVGALVRVTLARLIEP